MELPKKVVDLFAQNEIKVLGARYMDMAGDGTIPLTGAVYNVWKVSLQDAKGKQVEASVQVPIRPSREMLIEGVEASRTVDWVLTLFPPI